MRSDKRGGIVMDNLLGIILVGIALIIFVVAVYKFYETSLDQDAKSAQALADSIVAKVEALDEGSVNSTFRGVKDWYIVGWGIEDEDRPDKCALSSCICVCQGPLASDCQENGFCRGVGVPRVFVETRPVYGMSIGMSSATTGIFHRACIPLPANLIELTVVNAADDLNISYTAPVNSVGNLEKGIAAQLTLCGKLEGDGASFSGYIPSR